jgi:hypothetical protein
MSEIITVPNNTSPRDAVGVGGTLGGAVAVPPLIKVQPIQVVGLVPLYDCTATECRVQPDLGCCARLLVFGGTGVENESLVPPSYEVDYSHPMIDVAIYGPNSGATTVTIYLQKCSGRNTWTTVATLNNNTYGLYEPLGTWSNHPTYVGYFLNWARVLALEGAGIYRIKFTTVMRTKVGCLISAEYDLRVFNCNTADGTVKFEAMIKGKIGSHEGLRSL